MMQGERQTERLRESDSEGERKSHLEERWLVGAAGQECEDGKGKSYRSILLLDPTAGTQIRTNIYKWSLAKAAD